MVGDDFEDLYRAHLGQVYGLCLRLTGQPALAEDCTQECFIAAWRALPKFEGRSQLSTWLHRIAVNTVLAHRRRRPSDAMREADQLDEVAQVRMPRRPRGPWTSKPPSTGFRRARDVVVLVGVYGHSHEEAAQMLGIATGTSGAAASRRRLLAQQLGIAMEAA
jgi:RNA polymerase sigma-70 factor (ECF subfamily)